MTTCVYKMILIAAMAAMAFTLNAANNTWYVDDDNYGKSGLDGTTEAKAYGTIQDAIDAKTTLADDTILVLPGVYSRGTTQQNSLTRVAITKKLHIKATGTKEETHIVGCPTFNQPGDDGYGNGTNAVRAIYVSKDGLNSTLKGFTIRDSATPYATTSNHFARGGAIFVNGANRNFYVTDCVISNNVSGRYAGAAYGGTYLRCLIKGNHSRHSGSCFYASYAANCLIVDNWCISYDGCPIDSSGSGRLLNCTIVGNKCAANKSGNLAYNCLYANNYTADNEPTNEPSCVTSVNDGNLSLLSPVFGDFHPIAGSAAIGRGQTKYWTTDCPITFPDDADLRDYEGNEWDLTGETMTAGCLKTAATPQYGGIRISTSVKANDVTFYGANLFYATAWPQIAELYVNVHSTGHHLLVSGEGSDCLPVRHVNRGGYVKFIPPYPEGLVQTNTFFKSVTSRSVPDNYATPNAAQSDYASTTALGITIAAGDYREGGAVGRGVTNRICRTGNNCPARYMPNDADAAKTVIRGASATEERDSVKYPGCGPDAVRCVSIDSTGAKVFFSFSNMTFADGRTDCGQNAGKDQGGAAFGISDKPTSLTFTDCIFTNCWAPDAGVGVNAQFVRCKFVDCGSAGVGFKNCIVSSCVFENCDFKGGTFGAGCITVNCSDPSANAVGAGDNQVHVNSHFGFGTALPSTAKNYGTSLWGTFADAVNGDLRPTSGSSAVNASLRSFPAEGTGDFTLFANCFAAFATTAYNGDSWYFGGAYPIAGACQDWVRKHSLELFAPSVYAVAQSGRTLTIARKGDVVRHYGIVVDGVTNMLDSGVAEYVLPADAPMTNGLVIGVLDQNWYVNPNEDSGLGVVGDDDNNGFTVSSPKLTLKGVLSVATNSGDVVHAAAGLYKKEKMNYSSTYGDARAVVRGNIQLIGEGPEKSIIEGAFCADDESYGSGPGAMRCVMLDGGAIVSGFTLTNGHSSITHGTSSSGPTYGGGAVWGTGSSAGAVVNCKLSGSRSYSGGGSFKVPLFGCEVVGCRGNYGSATSYASVYGCFINNNQSHKDSSQVFRPGECYDTTIGSVNISGGANITVSANDKTKVVNSLMLGNVPKLLLTNMVVSCRNCAFVATRPDEDTTVDSIFKDAASDYSLDDDYRPIPRTSVLCGAASEELLPSGTVAADNVAKMRAARKLNAELDIGCYEADWKSVYSTDIATRRFTVTNVTSMVVETDDCTVKVPNGESLMASWANPLLVRRSFELNFVVTGEGSLTVTVNGVAHEYTAAAGNQQLQFVSALADNDIRFAYDGDDSGYAEILKGSSQTGLLLLVK